MRKPPPPYFKTEMTFMPVCKANCAKIKTYAFNEVKSWKEKKNKKKKIKLNIKIIITK